MAIAIPRDVEVSCLAHGPMSWRPGPMWWECVGFDGEGCATQLVYAEDAAVGPEAGIPGVKVTIRT